MNNQRLGAPPWVVYDISSTLRKSRVIRTLFGQSGLKCRLFSYHISNDNSGINYAILSSNIPLRVKFHPTAHSIFDSSQFSSQWSSIYFCDTDILTLFHFDNNILSLLFFVVKSCGEPETPENGRINSYLFTYNSAIEYSCDQGYTLVGSKRRVCQHNQTWTGTVPLCTCTLDFLRA